MNLVGSRPTLIANLSALVLASLVVAEGAYIVHKCFGYYRPQDIWGFLTPAIVMFIIRNRIFSYCFLALYIALFFQMFYQASIIPVDRAACGDKHDPLGYMAVLFVISIICLAIYAVRALVSIVASAAVSLGDQNNREFAAIVAAIAKRRKIDRSVAIDVTPLFLPMLDRISLAELNDYILDRYSPKRGEDHESKHDIVEIEDRELKSFDRSFIYKDVLTITFTYSDAWETVDKFQAVLLNRQFEL
ncbi:hypothetical protein V1277_006015 [Bradyrhizobium sp. AZCC 1588]|uniref:hypothetical protein n=1 Tax=unclassified Bradyrhizobium TaxID=2631580 RepID=UPI002FF39893